MNKVIFINRFFYPDQSATSQILSDLVFNIVDNIDSEIHIVSSRNTYQNDKQLDSVECINGVHIHRVWTSRFGRKNLLGRSFDYLSFYITTFFKLMSLVSRGDIVVAKTDPPVISFVAYIVCNLKKAHLVNWLQDLFPEVAAKLDLLKEDGLIYKTIKKIKDKTLLSASMNVVIGERMGERLKSIGVADTKVTVVPNWSINQDISYVDKIDNPLVKEWGLMGKVVIGYSGNFGRAHEYDAIFNLINEFKDYKNIVFLFIGGGKYYDDLQKHVLSEEIENTIFKPYQSLDVLNQSLSVADIHLISLRPELEGLIVPSKFFGLASIGANILFVGDCEGELGQLIKSKQCGYCCSAQELTKCISQIIAEAPDSVSLIENKKRLKKMYMDVYQPEKAYSAWVQIIKKISK